MSWEDDDFDPTPLKNTSIGVNSASKKQRSVEEEEKAVSMSEPSNTPKATQKRTKTEYQSKQANQTKTVTQNSNDGHKTTSETTEAPQNIKTKRNKSRKKQNAQNKDNDAVILVPPKQLTLVPYDRVRDHWPKLGNHIIASYTDTAVLVYQAFNDKIADYALKHQKFDGCPSYNTTRMTWIKTNFLWMMHRSLYGSKKNQNRVLGLWLKKSVFDEILSKGRLKGKGAGKTRVQWDPDYTPEFLVLKRRRDIQIGIKGRDSFRTGEDFVAIVDCSQLARESKATRSIPDERVYTPIDKEVYENLGLDKFNSKTKK